MTEQQQYLACAELDGLKGRHYYKCSDPWDGDCDICGGKAPSSKHEWPDYSTRDAVIGVIEKQDRTTAIKFICRLVEVSAGGSLKSEPEHSVGKMGCWTLVTATPAQLREALLRATNKWHD